MNVGPCMNGRCDAAGFSAVPAETVVPTCRVHSSAASVMYPPVSALPTHMMSGVTPAKSAANSAPVRPKPVAISSKTSRTPYSVHSCLARCSHSAG
eukprot:gene2036-biopygen2000